jgi:hypothetical protein
MRKVNGFAGTKPIPRSSGRAPASITSRVGTLHGHGAFEPTQPARPGSLLRTVVKLRLDGMSIGVGIPTRIAIVSG